MDKAGTIYVADTYNNRIRRITQAGAVTTVAGGVQGYLEGTGANARFYYPGGIAVDAAGTIFVADTYNHRVRRVQPDGSTLLVAGAGTNGFIDAIGGAAMFYQPRDLAVDANGNIYVADTSNNRVRMIDVNTAVSTVMGNGTAGYKDGPLKDSMVNQPAGVAVTSVGLFVADYNNNRIRLLKPEKKICNDFNECTSDSCDSGTGQCKFEPIQNCCAKEKLWLHFNDDDQAKELAFASCLASISNYVPTGCKAVAGKPGDKGWQVWKTAPSAISAPGALYYGDPVVKNYNWGANAGTVRTPKVALPAGAASVDFWVYFDSETGTKYDQFKTFLIVDDVRVNVGDAGQPNAGALFQKGQAPWVATKSWYNVKVDITKWAGKAVQLEFYFNTGDAVSNSTLGALVDDVKVIGICPK